MTSFLKIFFIVLLTTFLAKAQTIGQPKVLIPQARIGLNELHKTFKKGDTIRVTYKVKNAGTKDLIIEDVSSSCSCTIPSYSKNPIKPGATGNVTLSTTFDQISIFKEVYAVVKSNTKEKFNKIELWYYH